MFYILALLAIAGGAALPLQIGVNSTLARYLSSPLLTAAVSFFVGTAALLAYVLVARVPIPLAHAFANAPLWAWVGGLFGAFYVTCLRKTENGLKLCAYDWELATRHLPQHDLAEFLSFVLKPGASKEEIHHYVELHRQELQKATGVDIDQNQWRQGFRYCLGDLMINRFALYVMAHTFRHYGFMERVFKATRHMVRLELGV